MSFETVNTNGAFLRAYRRGTCSVGPAVVVYVVKNRLGRIRTGITSSRKIGKAVKRNRRRRVIREAVRAVGIDENQGFDLIFVARARTARVKSQSLVPFISRRLEESGVKIDKKSGNFPH